MKYVRLTLSAVIGIVALVPWLVLSAIGLACLYSADFIENVKSFLQDKAIGSCCPALLAAAMLSATAVASPAVSVSYSPVGASEYVDCESSVYIPFTNGLPAQAEFAVTVNFRATHTNQVEVALGRDRDGDGTLSFAETDVFFGWDGWYVGLFRPRRYDEYHYPWYFKAYNDGVNNVYDAKIESVTYRCVLQGLGRPARSFSLDVALAGGTVLALTPQYTWTSPDVVTTNRWASTYDAEAEPAFPWDSGWNMLRVTRRGADTGVDPSVSVSVRQAGGLIQLY